MQLSETEKLILNAITIIAWALGILLIITVITKGRKFREEIGISLKTYLTLVMITEVFYTIGAAMILSTMGVNIMRHLVNLAFWKFSRVVSKFDLSTVQVIGTIGWVGFVVNRSISFVSPSYLIIAGGKRLPRYFYYSAWTEVGLEALITVLIFISLIAG